jgi:DNA-directed RNA polymerase specialized sigma24 family protein
MEGNPILRRVVYLHEISEMTTGKTAEVLSVAEGTVKARVFRTAKSISGFERAAGNS